MLDGELVRLVDAPGSGCPLEVPRALDPSRRARRGVGFVGQHAIDGGSHLVGLVGIDERPGVGEHFRKRATIGGDDGNTDRHRLEDRKPEAFFKRRLHEQTRALVQLASLGGLDVTDVPDGTYRLWISVDRNGWFHEKRRDNNVTWVDLDIVSDEQGSRDLQNIRSGPAIRHRD